MSECYLSIMTYLIKQLITHKGDRKQPESTSYGKISETISIVIGFTRYISWLDQSHRSGEVSLSPYIKGNFFPDSWLIIVG